MKDYLLVCQVFSKGLLLYIGVHPLTNIPEFTGDFFLPQSVDVGPIEAKLIVIDKDNNLIAYKTFMAPASPRLITRLLNINILTLIKNILQS
jgi:hypothetical protein